MDRSYLLLYLDDYHLSDVLFLQSLARALAQAGAGAGGMMAVHGSGEEAERLLEGEGLFIEREAGVLAVQSSEEAALVARSMRQTNRRLVALFTEAVVATVGVTGAERRVLEMSPAEGLAVRDASWLEALTARRVVPIIAAYAREEGSERAGEVALVDATTALARALAPASVTVATFTTTSLPGVMAGKQPRPSLPLSELPEAKGISDVEAVRSMVEAGLDVLLTNTTRLADEGGPVGTRIVR